MLHSILLLVFAMNTTLPTITLSKNEWTALPQNRFRQATDGQESAQQTLVRLKYDEQFLYVAFDCQQDPFVHQNSYTQHNTEMWNQEVFELFIAEGQETPTRYLELEINPNNALFVGWIDNPSKEAPKNLTFVPYETAGIKHNIKKEKESWSGEMQIPWELLGGKKDKYRLNFYRIVSLQSHPNSDWKCTPTDCAFLCWSSSMSGKTPRFHRPDAFGRLELR